MNLALNLPDQSHRHQSVRSIISNRSMSSLWNTDAHCCSSLYAVAFYLQPNPDLIYHLCHLHHNEAARINDRMQREFPYQIGRLRSLLPAAKVGCVSGQHGGLGRRSDCRQILSNIEHVIVAHHGPLDQEKLERIVNIILHGDHTHPVSEVDLDRKGGSGASACA